MKLPVKYNLRDAVISDAWLDARNTKTLQDERGMLIREYPLTLRFVERGNTEINLPA